MKNSKAKPLGSQTARRPKKRRAVSFVANVRQPVKTLFGAAVRQRRLELRLTQREVSLAARLSRSFISEVECGHENISLERADRLAQALGTELCDLLKRP